MATPALGIVVSRADVASVRIGEALRERADWIVDEDGGRDDADGGGQFHRLDGAELRTFEDRHLDLDGVASAFGGGAGMPDRVVFASRHAGDTGPLLTVHHTGNAGGADHGGRANELARAAPAATKRALGALAAAAPDGYDASMECTHHGPSRVGAPSLFVEVGSAEPEWTDPAAAGAAAEAILALRDPMASRALVGIGGGHYAPRFDRLARETPWAVGHVIADWGIDAMPPPKTEAGRGVLRAAFERSGARHAVVDGDHPAVERAIRDGGYRVVSETWVREVGTAPLDRVAAVEDRLGSIDGGVRLGDRATAGGTGDLAVVDLPDGLVDEARGIDRDAARAAVERVVVGFETDDGGVGTRCVLDDPADRDAVVDGLAGVLDRKYDRVDWADGGEAVVAERAAFDPGAARDRGVPEGPDFGRLADGEPVTVGGETVRPDEVTTTERCRFDVVRVSRPSDPKGKDK